jgi:PKD repeat protein
MMMGRNTSLTYTEAEYMSKSKTVSNKKILRTKKKCTFQVNTKIPIQTILFKKENNKRLLTATKFEKVK